MESEYLNLLRLFHAARVEYVIVGGYAVIAHGFPRTTSDIDILVRPTPENARRTVRALIEYGFTHGEFEEADFLKLPNFLSFSRQDLWIDLLTQVKGVSYEECATNALIVETANLPVRYINLRALRKAKAAINRPQDLQDLENLPPS
ncbi:nucleotidyltransferase family protein [Hymenobacter psoromatis]|uniref:nucleotidyltransferase family protein n=1 Tax=Hymenobacter psoromatis TaxID=1484116 RepID=UPI001CC0F2DE|nr:nucleotidyltransferase family protein [Hymenobacter psoromatis]